MNRLAIVALVVACAYQASAASFLDDDDIFGQDPSSLGLGGLGGGLGGPGGLAGLGHLGGLGGLGGLGAGYPGYNPGFGVTGYPSYYNPYRIYRGGAIAGPAGVIGGYRGPYGDLGLGFSGVFGSGAALYRPRYPFTAGLYPSPISTYSGFSDSGRAGSPGRKQ